MSADPIQDLKLCFMDHNNLDDWWNENKDCEIDIDKLDEWHREWYVAKRQTHLRSVIRRELAQIDRLIPLAGFTFDFETLEQYRNLSQQVVLRSVIADIKRMAETDATNARIKHEMATREQLKDELAKCGQATARETIHSLEASIRAEHMQEVKRLKASNDKLLAEIAKLRDSK